MPRVILFILVYCICLASGCNKSDSLAQAVERGDIDAVQSLLFAGAVPDQIDGIGRPLLVRAAQDGQEEIALLLLEHGANGEVEFRGVPTLYFATFGPRCQYKLVQRLLKLGASPTAMEPLTQMSAILNVAAAGDVKCMDLLLRFGADPESVNVRNENLAFHAAMSGDLSAVKAVAALGVPLDLKSEQHVTPLMVAAAGGFGEIVTFLITEGADHCGIDVRGRTARDIALANDQHGVVKYIPECAGT